MLPLRLHHVGQVVSDMPAAAARLTCAFGYREATPILHDPRQTALVQFLLLPPETVYLELVAPDSPQSKLTQAARRGGSLHHLCYLSGPLDLQIAALEAEGLRLISEPIPAIAFDGRRICWLFGPDQVLVELVERRTPTDPALRVPHKPARALFSEKVPPGVAKHHPASVKDVKRRYARTLRYDRNAPQTSTNTMSKRHPSRASQTLRILLAGVCVLLILFIGAAQVLHTHATTEAANPGCSLCAVAHLSVLTTPVCDSPVSLKASASPSDPVIASAPPRHIPFATYVRPPPPVLTSPA